MSKDVAITTPASDSVVPIPKPDQASALIQVIERASINPDVDVEKMERLFEMHQKITAKSAEEAFNASMSRAQSRMGRVSADAQNPQTRSNYASYAALDRALRPLYTDEGFALSFSTDDGAPEDSVRVVCYVSHSAGHSRKYHADMPADGKGAKGNAVMTKTHATGAAMSYGMRYLLKLIFNVAIGEDDTDGNNPIERISDEQAMTIQSKIEDNGLDMPKFMEWLRARFKCDLISDLNVKCYQDVISTIDQQIKNKKGK